jgi:MoxR-like ATPase
MAAPPPQPQPGTHRSANVAVFDQIAERCRKLREELHRVIVGQDQTIEHLLAALFCQGHVLIVGVPGLAKTLLVRTLAQALDLQFKRIQFTPDMMPSDILGTELIQEDPRTGERSLRFMPGPIFAQLLLADEINRTPPKTQAALLEGMAERQVTVAGKTLPLDEPFVVVATQNPIEQEGTYPLPEAQLDRFMFSLWMDYPAQDEEVRIVAETPRIMSERVSPVFDRQTLIASVAAINQMPVSAHVVQYAVALARATRPNDSQGLDVSKRYVAWGAGPRAGQNLILGAKALAAIEGAPTPGCDHVRKLAAAVLRHRVVVNYAATGEGIDSAAVIAEVVKKVPEPTY